MNNVYSVEKATISKSIFNVGSTIPGRFGAFVLFGLTILSLAGCGGGGSNSGSNMQIRPPSGDGPDLVISNFEIEVSGSGRQIDTHFTVRNQGNKRAPQTTFYYRMDGLKYTSNPVPSLGPSETFSDRGIFGNSSTGVISYVVCVNSVSGESNTTNNCDEVSVTVSGSGFGSNGGGSGGNGGSGPVTSTWACPFGSGASITVGHGGRQVLINAEIHFRGNTCGNFWVSAAGAGTSYYRSDEGLVSFHNEPNPNIGGRRGITFTNYNDSGRTVVRQYTAYFCSKSEVSDSAFCYRGEERSRSSFTVRWLSR